MPRSARARDRPSSCSSATASSPAARSSSEGVPGGFALAYQVLSRFEETGRARRGYFIEGLGAAQFATAGDRRPAARLHPRTAMRRADRRSRVTLAATDPANPYGAALPGRPADRPTTRRAATAPAARPGALVVLVDGALALYVERGGKTAAHLRTDDEAVLAGRGIRRSPPRCASRLGKLRVEKVDGVFVIGTPLGDALTAAGFATTPQGLRLRG